MSAAKLLGLICFSASLYAQLSAMPGITVSGELRSNGDPGSSEFLVELYDMRTNAIVQRVPVTHGQFELDGVPSGSYSVRLVTAAGAPPIVEQYHHFDQSNSPLILDLPQPVHSQPVAGTVALHELEHPIPKKALRSAYEAEQAALANDLPAAIAKLQKAIQIDPQYRDAHVNLGVQYARSKRLSEARTEFQKALDIGPPNGPIYANLALACAASGESEDAAKFARKALELEPANKTALTVLQALSSH